MYPYLGKVRPGSTLFVPFHTFDSNDPSASVTITGLATTDIEVYKDASMTQRASDSGYALVDTDGIDIDTTTGIHGITIDLSDNTTAGFWSAGSDYVVVIASITVDAATINFIPVRFSIGYPNALYDTTIATLSTQTSFTLTNGPAEDDALNGMWCVIHDVASDVQMGHALISDYTGSTKTVTLVSGTTFTAAATDNISIMGLAPLQPTTLGNKLDVTATGAAGINWGNIENKTTANDLSATDIQLCNTTTTVTNQVTANVTAVSGDSAAADNLAADYDGTGYTKTNSTIGTCTTNTDMRGTDSAALASNYTAARAGYLDNINGHTAQTGDSFARLGAPAGASVSADIATVDSNVDAIFVDTGTTLPALISALNDVSVSDILTTQMTEAYAADGTAPTLAQALFLIQQSLGDFAISGTTITVKKLDGSTTAATYTLDDGTSPTSRTRST